MLHTPRKDFGHFEIPLSSQHVTASVVSFIMRDMIWISELLSVLSSFASSRCRFVADAVCLFSRWDFLFSFLLFF
jgi:hypothetical protein